MYKNLLLFCIVIVLFTCGKSPSSIRSAIASLPRMSKTLPKSNSHFEFAWQTRDSLLLYGQGWQPDTSPRAVVCLLHGLGEHSGCYSQFAQFLTDSGFAVVAFDSRGHGKSQGQRGHYPNIGVVMNDCTLFLKEIKKGFSGIPIFLYGQSTGGTFVIDYILKNNLKFAGVIAAAPLLRPGFKPPVWKLLLGKMMYHLWPTLTLSNSVDLDGLSRDPAVIASRKNDTLCHDRVTARFIGILDAGEWALWNTYRLDLPLLIMHGDSDRITSLAASREFAEKAGTLCTLKIWKGFYHLLHEEPGKEEVMTYCIEWMKKRLLKSHRRKVK